MEVVETVARGVLLGVAVAAPLGPVGVLCLRRGLVAGWWAGFVSGLGAATADGLYALVAAGGYAALTALLEGLRTPLRLVGAIVLLAFGVAVLRSPDPRQAAADPRSGSALRGYLQVLGLTLANPLTVLSFVALVAAAGIKADGAASVAVTGLAVGLGSALWWAVLASLAAGLRTRLTSRLLRGVDVGLGLLLVVLAALLTLDALRASGTP